LNVMRVRKNNSDNDQPSNKVNEAEVLYQLAYESQKNGFVYETEDDRLLKDASRSGIEKLQLFTQMIRRNRLLKSKD
jgi:hypothetical protein